MMSDRQFFPICSAYLCLGCDCVGNDAMVCPACHSRVLLCLANVLNREQEKEAV